MTNQNKQLDLEEKMSKKTTKSLDLPKNEQINFSTTKHNDFQTKNYSMKIRWTYFDLYWRAYR